MTQCAYYVEHTVHHNRIFLARGVGESNNYQLDAEMGNISHDWKETAFRILSDI